jgi:hypothetical protein
MGFFSSSTPKKELTQSEFIHHRIHAKLRSVFGYGKSNDKKWNALKGALEIEEDQVHHRARVKHALEEDDMEKKLQRLIEKGLLTKAEAEKIRDVTDSDIHT